MALFDRVRSGCKSAGLIAGLLAATALPAIAQQASLEGSWSGGGTVTFSTGNVESARCKASFRRRSGETFAMNAVCATPSGRVAQTAELNRVSNTRFSGEFHNSEYGITGNISITLRGNTLSASLDGGGASASFSLSK